MLDPAPLFLGAGRRAMGLHIGAVDRDRAAEMSGFGQRREHVLPNLATGPAVETIVDRRPRAVFGRAVAPAAAGPPHMENAVQDAVVIEPPGVRLTYRHNWLDQKTNIS